MDLDLSSINREHYHNNAFRLLGLPASARKRQIAARRRDLLTAAEMNDEGSIKELVIGGFGKLPDEYELRDAADKLNDPGRRMLDEIFWFQFEEDEEQVVAAFREGTPEAIQRLQAAWLETESRGEGTTASHNLAVYYHLLALELEERLASGGSSPTTREDCDYAWRQALVRWRWLLGQSDFWVWIRTRIESIGAGRLAPDAADQLERELPKALLAINAWLALQAIEAARDRDVGNERALLEAVGFDGALVADAMATAARRLTDRALERIRAAASRIKAEPGNALQRAAPRGGT